MAGAVKHMERSHRSHNSGQAEYRRFISASLHKNALKQATEKKMSLVERIASLFNRHQDR
jgi:hypothetical protein